jgi:uncharacterized protein DUF4440
MKRLVHAVNAGSLLFCAAAILLLRAPSSFGDNSDPVAAADRALLRAFDKRDPAALEELLDAEFIWIDSNGRRLNRAELLENLPPVANSDVETQIRTYGEAAVVRANRGRMNVLRIWVKRATGWRAMLYQEVLQVQKSETSGGKPYTECVNPCKTIPYHPQTEAEKEAIASWQGVMKAMAENDANAYSPLIADEFTATDTYHDRPYTKSDRLSQIAKQKTSGTRSSPPELLSAEMFDFGDTVMMVAKEQRPGAKSYFNTRMWIKRDARWQMLFSFNTRIE